MEREVLGIGNGYFRLSGTGISGYWEREFPEIFLFEALKEGSVHKRWKQKRIIEWYKIPEIGNVNYRVSGTGISGYREREFPGIENGISRKSYSIWSSQGSFSPQKVKAEKDDWIFLLLAFECNIISWNKFTRDSNFKSQKWNRVLFLQKKCFWVVAFFVSLLELQIGMRKFRKKRLIFKTFCDTIFQICK